MYLSNGRTEQHFRTSSTGRFVVQSFAILLTLLVCGDAFLSPSKMLILERQILRSPLVLGMSTRPSSTKGMDRVVIVQAGFGCCHGRNPTKAAVRACCNAIDSNSVKIRTIIPGGYEAMKIHIQIGVPDGIGNVDVGAIQAEFPYGSLLPIEVISGGMLASNGIWQPGVAEPKDDMTLAVACVTIGYDEPREEIVSQ